MSECVVVLQYYSTQSMHYCQGVGQKKFALDLHAAHPYLAPVANCDAANSGALASLPSEPPRETTGWLFGPVAQMVRAVDS